jgi:hypothetical protein
MAEEVHYSATSSRQSGNLYVGMTTDAVLTDGEHPDVDKPDEEDMRYFSSHFSHRPTLFLIDEIDQKGGMPGSDVSGWASPKTDFIFVADSAWIDLKKDQADIIAHEIGHLFGANHSDGGLMEVAFPFPTRDDGFPPETVAKMRKNAHLHKVRANAITIEGDVSATDGEIK